MSDTSSNYESFSNDFEDEEEISSSINFEYEDDFEDFESSIPSKLIEEGIQRIKNRNPETSSSSHLENNLNDHTIAKALASVKQKSRPQIPPEPTTTVPTHLVDKIKLQTLELKMQRVCILSHLCLQ